MNTNIKDTAQKVAQLIYDAGGNLTGRIRMQKMIFLLELAGEERGFCFDYHFYGPYSEDLSHASDHAKTFGFIREDIRSTSWGGYYSTFSLLEMGKTECADECSDIRRKMIEQTKNISAIVLELAATAAYFAVTSAVDPWEEVKEKKADKATEERIREAKALYNRLCECSPKLPKIG